MSNVKSITSRRHAGALAGMPIGGEATIALLQPNITRSRSIMRALQSRRSSREFSSRALNAQVLANLLWAAQGVNRPASGDRTTPSAHDSREMRVFAVRADGCDLYQPERHALVRHCAGDLRAATGSQPFVAAAPLNLVYVSDFREPQELAESERMLYAAAEAGCIAQSVYLYCAASGLATVVRGLVDRIGLAQAMNLADGQRVILAQTVGYPARRP